MEGRGTDNIDPRPAARVSAPIETVHHDHHDDHPHSDEAAPEDAGDGSADALAALRLESPATELRVGDGAQDDGVQGEGEVIEAHRRLGRARIAHGVLVADEGRVQEGGGRDGITDEAEHIDVGKVDRQPDGGSPAPVEQRLPVEGGAPTEDAARRADLFRKLVSPISRGGTSIWKNKKTKTYYDHPSNLIVARELVSQKRGVGSRESYMGEKDPYLEMTLARGTRSRSDMIVEKALGGSYRDMCMVLVAKSNRSSRRRR